MVAVYILIGILILSVIIISHELGHFITAKMTGVRVEEFGIGYPPRLYGIKRGETLYSINAIPFGGFNRLTGEEDPSDPRSLAAKKRWPRLLVITGGTIANILLALLVFSVSFLLPQKTWEGDVRIEAITVNSPAEQAGLMVGDIILTIEGEPVRDNNELSRLIQEHLGETITLGIQRQDPVVTEITIVPRVNPPAGEGHVGIMTSLTNLVPVSFSYPVWRAVPLGVVEMWNVVAVQVSGIISIFRGETAASFIGPVAMVQLTGEVAALGIVPVLRLAGIISLLLGLTNMLPVPALDGSRVAFIVLEAIRGGKRVNPRTEGLVHFVGFALLILLSIVIAFQDIMRIISGQSLLG